MNLHRMITELEEERDRLDQAILALERLSRTHPKGRRTGVGQGTSSEPADAPADTADAPAGEEARTAG